MTIDLHDLYDDHVARIRYLRAIRVHEVFKGRRRRAEERKRTNDMIRFHVARLRALRAQQDGGRSRARA